MREMRDSGVEWIGEIPKDWNCCKQKYRFTLINGRAFKDNEFEEDGTYRILRVGNLFSNPVWYSSSLELEPDKYCEKGDLIYAWSMSYGPYIWNEEKVIYHYHIWKTKLVSDMDKMFSYYYLQALTESIKSQTHETTMGFVTMGIMNNSYIAYPRNIKEQKKISDYLDAKCSKIDEIIEKQLSIIEKLKEYKISIITEVVTKGLDYEVDYKESGTEWLGKIPSHWQYLSFKNVLKERNEKNFPVKTAERLSLSIDKGVTLYSEKTTNLDRFKDDVSQYKLAHEGDFVLNSMNMIVGAVGISHYFGCVSPAYYTYYDNEEDHITAKYCDYLFHSKTVKKVLHSLGKGIMSIDRGDDRINTCRLKVSRTDLRALKIPVPPICEQREIVKYLQSKENLIDKTIADRNKAIDKFQEYKKSLIYEVVTGKKEV